MKIVFFHFEKMKDLKQMPSEITVNIIQLIGGLTVEFRLCHDQISNCINKKTYEKNSNPLSHSDSTMVGAKQIYKLELSPEELTEINKVEKGAAIIVILKKTVDPEHNNGTS